MGVALRCLEVPRVTIVAEFRGTERFRVTRRRVVLVVVRETKWHEIIRRRVRTIVVDMCDLQSLEVIIVL